MNLFFECGNNITCSEEKTSKENNNYYVFDNLFAFHWDNIQTICTIHSNDTPFAIKDNKLFVDNIIILYCIKNFLNHNYLLKKS